MLLFFKKKKQNNQYTETVSQRQVQTSSIQDFSFKAKFERLLTFLISFGIIFQMFGAKYLNDRKP